MRSEHKDQESGKYRTRLFGPIRVYYCNGHNLALPVWGSVAAELGRPLHLISFVSCADIKPPFFKYLSDKDRVIKWEKNRLERNGISSIMKQAQVITIAEGSALLKRDGLSAGEIEKWLEALLQTVAPC